MTLTALLKVVSPAEEAVRTDLRASLNRADLTGYDFIPPATISAAIDEVWQNVGNDGTRSFISFVNSLLDGTGWAVNEEKMALGEHGAHIMLLRNS